MVICGGTSEGTRITLRTSTMHMTNTIGSGAFNLFSPMIFKDMQYYGRGFVSVSGGYGPNQVEAQGGPALAVPGITQSDPDWITNISPVTYCQAVQRC